MATAVKIYKRMWKQLIQWWFIVALIVAEGVLLWRNFVPGTYLLGWDNTVPEFNLQLNLVRILNSVWQEYRGLGVVDGMAHAANIVHWVYVALLSLILPQNLVRYMFMGVMHVVGGLGAWQLLRYLLKRSRAGVAEVGAIFYMFNFGVAQMFYVPLELFVIHYAFLPWLLLTLIRYLETGKRKALVLFGLVNIMALSQAHVPSVFIVYGLVVGLVLLWHPRRAGAIVAILLAVNAFWGLPFVYSTLRSAGVIANTKVNQMTTEEVFLRNHAFGDFASVALFHSFNLDYVDYREGGKADFMFAPWKRHLDQPEIQILAWGWFGLTVVGLIRVVVKRERLWIPIAVIWGVGFMMLGSGIPILESISWFLRNYIPLFGQVFRFTFTKFVVIYALGYSLLLAYGLDWLLKGVKMGKMGAYLGSSMLLGGILWYAWPAFHGQWFYPEIKQAVPSEYFELIDFFKRQSTGERVAILPSPGYWAWTTNRWGHRGSGWLWQAIPQPIMDRAFDPWSKFNEQYYWELSTAVNRGEGRLLDAVWEKYRVVWVVVDASILDTTSPKPMNVDSLHATLTTTGKVSLVKQFGEIRVYRVRLENENDQFVWSQDKWWVRGDSSNNEWVDQGFIDQGHYVVNSQEPSMSYLFPSLFTNKLQQDVEFVVEEEEKAVIIAPKNSGQLFNGVIRGIDLANVETLVPVQMIVRRQGEDLKLIFQFLMPELILDGETQQWQPSDGADIRLRSGMRLVINGADYEVTEGVLGETYLLTNLPNVIEVEGKQREYWIPSGLLRMPDVAIDRLKEIAMRVPLVEGKFGENLVEQVGKEKKSCQPMARGTYKKQVDSENRVITYTAQGNSACETVGLNDLFHSQAYLLKVVSEHKSGLPAKLLVMSHSLQKAVLETFLPEASKRAESWWIVPPTEKYNRGYDVTMDVFSVGKEVAKSRLWSVQVWPMPYEFLKRLRWEKEEWVSMAGAKVKNVTHPVPSIYVLEMDRGGMVALGQGYESGWTAIGFGRPLLVNGWANGWFIPEDKKKVVIVYLPQLLEWVGLAMPAIAALYSAGRRGVLGVTGLGIAYRVLRDTKGKN